MSDWRLRYASGLLAAMSVAAWVVPCALDYFCGYGVAQQNLALGATAPSTAHLFGTDFFGRDLLVRSLVGLRISLAVGLCAGVVAATVGTLYGSVAGWAGGLMGGAMMRAVDLIGVLPYMFMVILLVTLLGKSLVLIFVALGLTGWLMMARIVRGQVLALKERDFIIALVGLGAGHFRIVLRHLIPNTAGAIVVVFTLSVPTLILEEAFLSFLGLGVQAPHPSLGSLIAEGAEAMSISWWLLVFPGGLLTLLLLTLHLLGEAVSDAFDPQSRGR